jgi:flagellar biosynthesis/type III secretory pathway protein FliH
MSYAEKEKLIKADLASIENRVRHAFNQGYDLGYKEGKATASNKAVANLADDIEGLTWYRVANGQLTEGANSKTDTPLYKACDIERILEKYKG